MNAQYCPDCGAEVATGSRYCSNCGERITAVTQSPTQTTDPGYAHAAEKDTTFAAITHVLALFTWVLGPLIVLLVTDDAFVHENARNALNWQIMFTVYMIISGILVFVLIGIPLIIIIPLLDMVFCIIAALKANEGEAWRYPATPDIV
ncbi:DUF4870 domain-containing protein [Natronosalvus vescus]|uniref:DUF4870 domain-containing protein n=1 Tax=Natronosalvus vescus TaxID=2953881 RepID=UPI002090DB8E|nr:zinc ribbon domain-containing protein [Natronosalvus vescus]